MLRWGPRSKYRSNCLAAVWPWIKHFISLWLFPLLKNKSCPTLCDPRDGSPPGSSIPRILQARTLEWVAISFSNAWKWKVKVKSLSRVQPSATHGLQPTRLLCPWDFPGKNKASSQISLLPTSRVNSRMSSTYNKTSTLGEAHGKQHPGLHIWMHMLSYLCYWHCWSDALWAVYEMLLRFSLPLMFCWYFLWSWLI